MITKANVQAGNVSLEREDKIVDGEKVSEVMVRYVNPASGNAYARMVEIPWAEACEIPRLLDELKRLFGEKTALDG